MKHAGGFANGPELLRDAGAAPAPPSAASGSRASHVAWPVLLALLLVALAARPAHACSCIGDIPPCQSFWKADAVFAGEVLSFEQINPDQPFSRRVARLRIDRAWRGQAAEIVEVQTGAGGGDCGYSFRRGENYLVYAYRAADGSLTTGICSPTKPLAKADADLEYIKALESPSEGGRVFGSVHYESKGGALTPATAAPVILTGNDQSRSVRTRNDGGFEFADLPAGKYEVTVEGSPLPPWNVEIRDPHACAVVSMWLPRPSRTP